MDRLGWRSALSAAALGVSLAAPASAGVVTFEDVPYVFDAGGASIASGGFNFAIGTAGGFGGVLDAPFLPVAPTGNATMFYFGPNDGDVTMSQVGGDRFILYGLDAAFLPQLASVPGANSPGGRLLVNAALFGGGNVSVALDLGMSDGNGAFAFQSFGLGDLGAVGGVYLQSVNFRACVYAGQACVNPASGAAQFGLDNIGVPEPGALALAALGLVLVGAKRRRVVR